MSDQPDARPSADLLRQWRDFAPDLAQLLDGWHQDGTAWSEWDEQIRQRLSTLQPDTERHLSAPEAA